MKILVIEKNKEIRENTAELLELDGYSVLTAVNGKEGFDLAVSMKPDMVISDHSNARTFLRQMKSHESTKPIPILFFSAEVLSTGEASEWMTPGDAFLHKPFTREQLQAAVRKSLASSTKRSA